MNDTQLIMYYAMAACDGGKCPPWMLALLTGSYCPYPRQAEWTEYGFVVGR